MVAKAMVHSPPELVLDDPTAGVDIELRRSLWAHVRALNRAGTTIVLTTHYLEEAEELCDRIAIIDHGRIVACDSTANLLSSVDSKTLVVSLSEPLDALPPALAARGLERAGAARLVVRYRPSETRLGDLLNLMDQAGVRIADLTTEETDLEDIFLQLTGEGAAAARRAAGE